LPKTRVNEDYIQNFNNKGISYSIIPIYLYMYPSNILKNENYHTVGTIPKSNRKIIERGKTDTPNTQIHDRSLTWL